MRRLVLALLVVVCVLAASTATAAARVSTEFKLPVSEGFTAEVEAVGEKAGGEVTLSLITRDQLSGHWNSYTARGEVLETGIEVSFGSLGQISFEFQPTSSRSEPAGPGCNGERWTTKEGFFVGEAEFHGERGFATIDVHRVKATVRVDPERRCLPRSDPSGRAAPGPRSESELGALRARAEDGRIFLAVGEHERGEEAGAGYLAGLVEHEEDMRIARIAYANTKHSGRFLFDHDAGTAFIRPPAPFRGHASFRRHGNAKQPGTWRGNLSVTLLGHDAIGLAGPAFRATLSRDSPFGD